MIAIYSGLWYTSNCLGEQIRGVLLLNAVDQHNTFIVGKAPHISGLTSRCSPRQRRQANMGRFVVKIDRKCIDCESILTGHSNATRCRRCAARQRYIDRNGKPPDRLITNCEMCGKEFSDYASNRRKDKHGVHFCSPKYRAEWVGIHNSLSNNGDGIKRTKAERDHVYYVENADRIRRRSNKYHQENSNEVISRRRQKDRQLKQEIIDAYGGKCECCGEATFEFMTIDHINGDGAEHRRQIGGKGRNLYKAIKAEGFPKDRYRLLCFNCNIALGFYGYCPHHPERKANVSHVPFNPGRKRTVK